MVYGAEAIRMIDIGRVFLDQENPRHEPYQNQDEVIEYLCKEEKTLEIAKDIAKNGLNPLDLFALIPETVADMNQNGTFVAAEGNRRLCAVKLLHDPDLAPTDKRKGFENAAKTWTPIDEISAIVFDDRDAVKLWLERTHSGLADGIGRKPWNAEQKARHTANVKNKLAMSILDYAQKRGLITSEDRKGRLSTVQRYLGNPHMREALGVHTNELNKVSRIRPLEEFEITLKEFMKDVVSRTITTRKNSSSKDITNYSRKLRTLKDVTSNLIPPVPLEDDPANKDNSKAQSKPQKPEKITHIPYDEKLHDALKGLTNYKLEKLYYSICKIPLRDHTPLLAVGVWAFIETLTANAGRKSHISFSDFLSAQNLRNLGLGGNANRDTKSIREIVTRISENGNSTKHDKNSAAFNGEQLANDVDTLREVLLKLIEEVKNNNTGS